MKIISLNLQDGLSAGSYDFDNLTVITSQHNKSGKTTLLRCLLYALGYPIPSMRGLSFDKMRFDIEIQNEDGLGLRLKRIDETIECVCSKTKEKTMYSLPSDRNRLHQMIFGIKDETVLDNLLGAYYFDQEKGWTLLNRGRVIGGIRFSIENFLRGLIGRSCTKERAKLAAVKQEIIKYKYMLNVAQYKVELTQSGDVIPFDTPAEEIMREELLLRNKRKPLENEAHRLEGVIENNEEFRRYIDSMQLQVKTPAGETVLVSSNNIIGFSDIQHYLQAKLYDVQQQIAVFDNQIKVLEKKQDKSETLVSVETSIQRFAEEISRVSVDVPSVERILKGLKKQKVQLERIMRDVLLQERTAVEKLTKSILSYLNEFGIDEWFGRNIFTRNLKSVSGTIFHLQVFAFTISYAKLVRERTGCILPLLIDSPNGREVEKATVKKMMDVLRRDFSDHQIIIATIFNPNLPSQKTIALFNGVMNIENTSDETWKEQIITKHHQGLAK